MEINDFIKLLKARRSMRRFKTDPVPDEHIMKILEAARWSMSGANGQPWEFIVVKDPATRNKIVESYQEKTEHVYELEMSRIPEMRHLGLARSKQLPGFKDAPVLIVIAGDPRTLQASFMANHFLSGEAWATFYINIGNATQNIHLAAAALGLGAQWVSVNIYWEVKLKEILGIPTIYRLYTMVPIGYPSYRPSAAFRRDLDDIVHFDKYDLSKYKTTAQIRNYIRQVRTRTRDSYVI